MIRLLTFLGAIALPIWTIWQWITREIPGTVALNRLGRPTQARGDRPVIWIHAASLGELMAIRPVLRYLARAHATHAILVTVNNHRALDVVAGWTDVTLIGQVAPLDVPGILRRFLRHWQPVAFINIEAELWPNRFAAITRAGIPAIFLNARLSDKSLATVRRLGIAALHLDHFRHFFAQSAATTANLQALGLPRNRIETTPNLKSLVDLPAPHPILSTLDRAQVILAASTHAPEEAAVLQAFHSLRDTRPGLRLVLSPRHARRAEEVAELVRRIGLTPQMLSTLGSVPAPDTVVIADELGVQPALYACAAVTFVGGSLPEDVGGHTPYEPIRGGSAIVAGPNVSNFAAEYATLTAAEAAVMSDGKGDLARALSAALDSAPDLAGRAEAALPTPRDPKALFARISAKLDLH